MSCHVAPLWTVTVLRSSWSRISLKRVISSTTLPLAKACTPMLCFTPATETLSPCSRAYASDFWTSASDDIPTTPYTAVSSRQLASLTVPPFWTHGSELCGRAARACRLQQQCSACLDIDGGLLLSSSPHNYSSLTELSCENGTSLFAFASRSTRSCSRA